MAPPESTRADVTRWLESVNAVAQRSPLHAFPGVLDISYHPLFRDPVTRWVWRFYTHRVTMAGRWLCWPTFGMALYAVLSLDRPTFIPLCYLLALWILALTLACLFPPRVRITARHSRRVGAGERLALEIQLEQAGPLGGVGLAVLPVKLHPSMEVIPVTGARLPPLRPGQTARARLEIRCRSRGVFVLRGYRVQTDFPLGLFFAYRIVPAESAVLVYPAFEPLDRLELPAGRRYQPGGVALASALGEATEYIGNREYRDGDSPRLMDWRATARMGRPIVREYREEYFLRVAIVLDTHVPQRSNPARHVAMEAAISLCAGVADYLSRQEYVVDLFAAGPNLYHLTAGRSLAYLDEILDILACVEETRSEPFARIEPEIGESLAQIAVIVYLFLDWTDSRRDFVAHLKAHGVAAQVLVVHEGDPSRDPLLDVDLCGPIRCVRVEDVKR